MINLALHTQYSIMDTFYIWLFQPLFESQTQMNENKKKPSILPPKHATYTFKY